MTDNSYLFKPLTDREAGRLKTNLEQKKGVRLKYREIIGFSPDDIAKQHKLNASEIARYAGRSIPERSPV